MLLSELIKFIADNNIDITKIEFYHENAEGQLNAVDVLYIDSDGDVIMRQNP